MEEFNDKLSKKLKSFLSESNLSCFSKSDNEKSDMTLNFGEALSWNENKSCDYKLINETNVKPTNFYYSTSVNKAKLLEMKNAFKMLLQSQFSDEFYRKVLDREYMCLICNDSESGQSLGFAVWNIIQEKKRKIKMKWNDYICCSKKNDSKISSSSENIETNLNEDNLRINLNESQINNKIEERRNRNNQENQNSFIKDNFNKINPNIISINQNSVLLRQSKINDENITNNYPNHNIKCQNKLKSKKCELIAFCVLKEYQSQGIGSKMIEKLTEICINYNLRKIELVVQNKNHKAISFYRKLGFITKQFIEKYYNFKNDDDNKAIFMQKDISKISKNTKNTNDSIINKLRNIFLCKFTVYSDASDEE